MDIVRYVRDKLVAFGGLRRCAEALLCICSAKWKNKKVFIC